MLSDGSCHSKTCSVRTIDYYTEIITCMNITINEELLTIVIYQAAFPSKPCTYHLLAAAKSELLVKAASASDHQKGNSNQSLTQDDKGWLPK